MRGLFFVLISISNEVVNTIFVTTNTNGAFLNINSQSQNSLACTQNPLFVTSHGGLDMIFRDPTCPYAAVVVAVVVCVDVYY